MDPGQGPDADLTIVLLGKTGVGKSASGNTILGRTAFVSDLSFEPVTTEISEATGEVFGKVIKVIDTPGIDEDTDEDIKGLCQDVLQSSRPCLFLVVVKVGRFTREDDDAVKLAMEALGPEGIKRAYLLFTSGDVLKMSLEDFIFGKNKGKGKLPEKVGKFNGACHLFNNADQDPDQVQDLLQKSGLLRTSVVSREPVVLNDRRIVLLGRPGGGKSLSGNTILGSDEFRSGCGFNSVSTECVSASAEMEGHWVTVVDTPGFTDEVLTPEQVYMEIMKTLVEARPGPHAFVIVVKIDRITEADIKLFEILPAMFGDDASKYSMVLFTHGDKLRGQSIVQMINSNEHVSKLVSMCGGRYCVFNNKATRKGQQVREFIKKVDEMVSANGGGHYSSELFRMAETIIREERNTSDQASDRPLSGPSPDSPPSGPSPGCRPPGPPGKWSLKESMKRAWERLKRFLRFVYLKICAMFSGCLSSSSTDHSGPPYMPVPMTTLTIN